MRRTELLKSAIDWGFLFSFWTGTVVVLVAFSKGWI